MCNSPGFWELVFPFYCDMFDLKGIQVHLFEAKVTFTICFSFLCQKILRERAYKVNLMRLGMVNIQYAG